MPSRDPGDRRSYTLTTADGAEMIRAGVAMGDFFRILDARLAPGVSREAAQAEAGAVAARLAATYPDANEGGGAVVVPLADEILGKARPIMLLLLGTAGLVLLIACANIANLLLARHLARGKELAVRAALGASGRNLIGLLATEAVFYAVAGGALGVVLALWALDALIATVPASVLQSMPFLASAHVDGMVLAVTFGLSLATGVGVGVVSAARASRPDLGDVLKADGRASSDPRRSRLRDALVVSEVALAFLLLVGAGLVGVSPWDPTTFAVVGSGLLVIGLLASWPPTRAATRVDPVEALRSQ